jgi:tRNA-dihydrouridine synthase 1
MNIAEYYNYKQSGDKKLKLKAYDYEFDAADRPLILQLAGNTPDPIITLANQELFKGHIDGVDLNCGCPQGFAMEKKIGAGLLRNPDHLVDLARQISQAIPYPFSMKLRLHEDGVQTTIALMEKLVSTAKVAAFTVHGRFWWQKGEKRGVADWDALKMIREAIPKRIPLIGNGDVAVHDDFERFKSASGVDSVMVGYGALLDPTVFQPEKISLEQVLYDYLNIARRHRNGLVDVQRHIQWMVKRRSGGATEIKARLFQAQSLPSIQTVLASLNPALTFNIPELQPGESDRISYPKQVGQMTPKELKIHAARQQKNEIKLAKKLKRQEAANPDAIHSLPADPASAQAASSTDP